jgi:hypothetical protein
MSSASSSSSSSKSKSKPSVDWRSILFALQIALTGWLGSVYLMFPAALFSPLMFIFPKLYFVWISWRDFSQVEKENKMKKKKRSDTFCL